jgi:hypothetical protein
MNFFLLSRSNTSNPTFIRFVLLFFMAV